MAKLYVCGREVKCIPVAKKKAKVDYSYAVSCLEAVVKLNSWGDTKTHIKELKSAIKLLKGEK